MDVVARGGCRDCEALGDHYSQEGIQLPQAIELSVPVIARPLQSCQLRECGSCGALFEESWGGPPAADDLFDITTDLERIPPRRAVELLRLGT